VQHPKDPLFSIYCEFVLLDFLIISLIIRIIMKFNVTIFVLALLAAAATPVASADQVNPMALEAAKNCNQNYGPLDFVLLEDEAVNAAIEDNIRQDLEKIGFSVQARKLSKVR
jgi:hypothetical protein